MLTTYLKRLGLVTGPLSVNTSHSGLDVIKKWLCSEAQFKGGEIFLVFGNVFHTCMANQISIAKLRPTEQVAIKNMESNTRSHPIVKALLINAVLEQKFYTKLNGVQLAMILDVKQPSLKRGADYKTTTCATFEDFLETAIKYSYFRQGKTYKLGAGLKHFYFIAVQKVRPHKVFVLDVSLYPEEEQYAERELEFLIYFFKHYGKIIFK